MKGTTKKIQKYEHAFCDFSKEHDAYFYGLLLSDGNISKDTNAISLSLKESDLHLLEEFKAYLKSDRKILQQQTCKGRIQYRFIFDSALIKERLQEQNFEPRKSTRERLPNFNWQDNRHFWRGVVDGDGSLFFNKNSPKISLCGSKEILTGFNLFCAKHCFTKPKKLYKTNTENFYTVCYAGEEALRVMKLLYDGSKVHLNRKKILVKQYEEVFIPKSPNKNIRLLPSGRYNVKIGFNRKRVNVGTFDSYEEALEARRFAEIQYQGKIDNGSD